MRSVHTKFIHWWAWFITTGILSPGFEYAQALTLILLMVRFHFVGKVLYLALLFHPASLGFGWPSDFSTKADFI